MKGLAMRAWGIVFGIVSFLFGTARTARGEPQQAAGAVPGAKEPTVQTSPKVPVVSATRQIFAPPDAVRIVATYGAPQAGLGPDRSGFSARGPWEFMPDGSLRQVDKQRKVMLLKPSGEVLVYDALGHQVERTQAPAAAQFYRVMKQADDLRRRQAP